MALILVLILRPVRLLSPRLGGEAAVFFSTRNNSSGLDLFFFTLFRWFARCVSTPYSITLFFACATVRAGAAPTAIRWKRKWGNGEMPKTGAEKKSETAFLFCFFLLAFFVSGGRGAQHTIALQNGVFSNLVSFGRHCW